MNLIRIRLEVRVLVNLACPVAAVVGDSQAHREAVMCEHGPSSCAREQGSNPKEWQGGIRKTQTKPK